MAEPQGSSELFLVFFFALLILFLIPFTIYQVFFVKTQQEDVVKPWEQTDDKKSRPRSKILTTGNVVVAVLWIVAAVMLYVILNSNFESESFDPFKILNVSSAASDKDIKAAYRKLVVVLHPDKNPDPNASEQFIQVERAYKALSDQTAKDNWIKYGDPDGPQALGTGIAFPEWLFSDDRNRSVIILTALVGIGFVFPLVAVAIYIYVTSQTKKGQFGSHVEETSMLYLEKGIKQGLSLKNVPEALVLAADFLYQRPINKVQVEKIGRLKKVMIEYNSEYADPKHKIWKLHSTTVGILSGNVLKAYMYLTIHLLREHKEIPPELEKDFKFVMHRLQDLMKQFIALTFVPRPPSGAWLIPAISALEMSQSLYQAVSLADRKGSVLQKGTDFYAQLMQLPHINEEIMKKIQKQKVKDINDVALAMNIKPNYLQEIGFKDEEAIASVTKSVLTIPQVQCLCRIYVEGEQEIAAKDIVTIEVSTILFRHAHKKIKDSKQIKGDKTIAYTPYYPREKTEEWYFILCQQESNIVVMSKRVLLSDAERAGIDYGYDKSLKMIKTDCDNLTEEQQKTLIEKGQSMKIQFPIQKEGHYKFTMIVISDSYIGVERSLSLKMDAKPLTKEQEQKRIDRQQNPQQQIESNRDGSDGEKEEEEDEGENDDYDSEETGSVETDDEKEKDLDPKQFPVQQNGVSDKNQ